MNEGPRRLGGPGYALVERVQHAIARRRMLEGGEAVVVAVSGGPDSVCLLDALARLAGKLDLVLAVAHVDHGLSGESAQVAARVAESAARAGLEVHVVRAPDLSGPNLQARAREFRYGFFEIVARQENASRIATGHTLDDRVETTLARLVHGAGTDGLAGIPPVEGARIRPLIEVRRAEARAYCDELGLWYFDDPANEDERFERVAIRRSVIAPIQRRWGPGAIEAMATSAERLSEDATALREVADRLYADTVTAEGQTRKLALDALLGMPRAFRRRLLERAVGRVRDRSGGIDAALDALERGGAKTSRGARFAVASGIEIVIGDGELLVLTPNL